MNDKISQTVKQYKEAKEVGADVSDFLDLNNPKIREAFADENLTIGMALAGILEWDGVWEAESDETAPVCEQKIEELFQIFGLLLRIFVINIVAFVKFWKRKKRLNARCHWHFGKGRDYCKGCSEKYKLCPIEKCKYIETAPQTIEGWQAWEVLKRLSEPDLSQALNLAKNLGFDMEIMSELLTV